MSKPTFHLLVAAFIILIHTHIRISNGVSVSGINSVERSDLDPILTRGGDGGCSKKIGDSIEEEGEMMESEISRRVLVMQKKYISYETLKRDMVPCEKPGASYYECHAREAHSYSRGCEVITRCRGY
ncbi:ralf-like 24 [Euphorbia peplus]|nr:ralf-like 24 [Euphorbia peplus]